MKRLLETKPTGDWAADNRAGRMIAQAIMSDMRKAEAPGKLGFISQALAGRHDGVIVGFWHAIGEATL